MLNQSRKILLAAALIYGLTVSPDARAQTNKTTWTLQECVDYGLQNNLQLKQSGLNGELAQVNARQARSNMLPTVNGGGSYSINFGLNNDPTTGVLVNQNTQANSYSLSANVPLFNGFQLRNNIRQTQLDYQANLSDVEKAKNDVILNIVSAYLQIILSAELLEAAKLQLASSKEQAERTKKLFQAGSVAENNVFEINSQIASDEVNIINAQNDQEIARLNLVQLMNLQQVKVFNVIKPEIKDPDEDVIDFDADDVFSVAQQRMPEIKSADIRVNSALVGIQISRGALFPQLSLGGNFSTNFFNLNKIRILDAGQEQTLNQTIGYVNDDRNLPVKSLVTFKAPITEKYTYLTQLADNRGGGVFLNLNIPIFNGFSVRNQIARSEINHKNAILNANITRNQLRQTIQQSYADAVAAQRRFIATKQQLAALELTFRNAQIRFNNGVLNATDFNVARNNFTRAQLDLIQAKFQYTFRLKILDFYQGKPITL